MRLRQDLPVLTGNKPLGSGSLLSTPLAKASYGPILKLDPGAPGIVVIIGSIGVAVRTSALAE